MTSSYRSDVTLLGWRCCRNCACADVSAEYIQDAAHASTVTQQFSPECAGKLPFAAYEMRGLLDLWFVFRPSYQPGLQSDWLLGDNKTPEPRHALRILCCRIHRVKEYILGQFEGVKTVSGAFVDFTKAFDCVHRNILLCKLDYYGVRRLPLSRLSSCSSHRIYNILTLVIILPIKKRIISGVLRGSILRPYFLTYVLTILWI